MSPFGHIAGILQLQINHSTGAYTGQFVFAARGGTAFGTIQGQFTSANTYVEALTFTGGTGIYKDITGYACVMGSLNPDGTGQDMVKGGQICLPDRHDR